MDWVSSSAGSVLVTQVLDRWVSVWCVCTWKNPDGRGVKNIFCKNWILLPQIMLKCFYFYTENQLRRSFTAQFTRCYSRYIGPHTRAEFFFCGTYEWFWSSVHFTALTLSFWIKCLVKRSKVKIFNNRYTKLKDSDWGIKTSGQSHYFVVFCYILKMFGSDLQSPSDGNLKCQTTDEWRETRRCSHGCCSVEEYGRCWQNLVRLTAMSSEMFSVGTVVSKCQAEWLGQSRTSFTNTSRIFRHELLINVAKESEWRDSVIVHSSLLRYSTTVKLLFFTLMTTCRERSHGSVFSTLHRIHPPVM